MPKLKTKSGVKKRFRKTANGHIKRKYAYKRHLLTKKSKKRKRRLNKFSLLKKSDKRSILKKM